MSPEGREWDGKQDYLMKGQILMKTGQAETKALFLCLSCTTGLQQMERRLGNKDIDHIGYPVE